ncbi:MAG: T9SS type A sorting domain-containing protein [Chitinophagales bacterium]|nr:T9SS type A sorting domain-containing protein [Chitinophagales bacterium]
MPHFLLFVGRALQVVYTCFFAFVLLSGTLVAQSSIDLQKLPNLPYAGIPLVNTNGNWVTNTTAFPDDINNLETQIRTMPAKGLGIMGVEFQLRGADGGTATFRNGSQTQLAHAGQGGTVQFTYMLTSSSSYGKPFLVVYGKHGQSTNLFGLVATGGGGGSTGMCWLVPQIQYIKMFHETDFLPGYFIAGAGGGGGGWATLNAAKAGKGGGIATTDPYSNVASGGVGDNCTSSSVVSAYTTYSGSSSFMPDTNSFGIASSARHKTFSYSTGVYNNSYAITAVYAGQGGGQPIYYSKAQQQFQQVVANPSSVLYNYANCQPSPIYLGGAGGCGFFGGGAGACGSEDFGGMSYPGAGAGGAPAIDVEWNGSKLNLTNNFSTSAAYLRKPGWGGKLYCQSSSGEFTNISYVPGAVTTAPQSGSFSYRTIADNIPPVATVTTDTVTLSLQLSFSNPTAATQVTLPVNAAYAWATDNDSVKTLSFTKSIFNCNDVGFIRKVRLIATDFAGNVDTSDTELCVRVIDSAPPKIPTWPLSPNPVYRDIATGPYTVTQNDFPVATDNCSGITVNYSWTPRTFSCADLGGTYTVNYTVTDLNGNSATYAQQFIIVSSASSNNVYVDASATGANNGSNWANAYNNLQDALMNVCNNNRNFYIAAGTYYPDRGVLVNLNDRNQTFTLRDGDKLYGGFPSGGSVFADRNPSVNITVLSGNIGNISSTTDNSYHVVTIPSGVSKIMLEGVIIADGRGDENASSFGGGIKMLSAFNDSIERLTLKNSMLQNNYASGNGGGIGIPSIAFVGQVKAQNSVFVGNTAGGNGGAFYSSAIAFPSALSADFTNCLFRNNQSQNGGALFFSNTAARLTNCSAGYNKAANSGGAISSATATITVRNSILWGDTAGTAQNEIGSPGCSFTYSNIQGSGGSGAWVSATGVDNGMNIDVNPGYLSFPPMVIPPNSPCRNMGSKTLNDTNFDLAGVPRVVQDTIDMGAYEINPIVYVAADAPNGGDGNSWATAFNNLNDAIASAFNGFYLKDIWIKQGTYYPDRAANGTNQGRFNTFYLGYSNKLYGGFAGNETSFSQRDIPANPTILDGDIGVLGDTSDNAYHVVTYGGIFPLLDGLIIQNGNANHPTLNAYQNGGGIHYSGIAAAPTPIVRNCVFRNNSANFGGAISVMDAFSNHTFTAIQCLFYNNYATANGGAIYVLKGGNNNVDVALNLYNCTGANNIANGYFGGFVETINVNGAGNAITNIYNSLLWGNYVNQNGFGTVMQEYHNTNSNSATNIFSSHVGGASPLFTDINNPAGADGQIMTDDDGLIPQAASTTINSGSNTYIQEETTADITNSARVLQATVDAGAYETFGCPGLTALYVDSSVTTSGDGSSWATAYRYLNEAMGAANRCPQVDTIYIAQGTYYANGSNEYSASRDTAFYMSNSYSLYGGYPNGGGVRNVLSNKVTMSGNINSTTSNDNAYHILIIKTDTASMSVIDGITFADGNASVNGSYAINGIQFHRGYGAAIYVAASKVLINNCSFYNNAAFQGGAAVFANQGSKLTSTNSIYENNNARFGGAIRLEGNGTNSMGEVSKNVFYRNTSFNGGGGAISCFGGAHTITNNLFAYDSTLAQGGGANFTSGTYLIAQNTFFKSFATTGGGAFSLNGATGTQIIANNIFYDNNDTIANNPQYFIGGGVVSTLTANSELGNPQFSDTANLKGDDNRWATSDDGLFLKNTSNLINSGNVNYASGANDLSGAARVQLGKPDPGAYESVAMITRWYVNHAQDTAEQNGTSWATAFTKFEDGINAAKSGDSVWVAGGTYSPPVSGTSFAMKSNVKIYGGFAGNEQTLQQRNLSLGYNTTLSGNDTIVFVNNNVDTAALLDGFVITNGKGGGIQNNNSSPRIRNVVFNGNQSANGGAVANNNSSPKIQNVVFYNNTSSANGGAVYNVASNTEITNATFFSNTAASGGAVYNDNASLVSIGNSVFYGNSATAGADVFSAGNENINYSILQATHVGNGNIVGIDPLFTVRQLPGGFDGFWFTGDDGLQVSYLSPALNSGSNALSTGIATDITGALRIQNVTVDRGAYESALLGYCDSAGLNNQNVLYVDAGRAASGDGSTWENAFRTLSEALDRANYCPAIDTILVARGNYFPKGYQSNTDRSASFTILRSGLHVKGGYPNGGGARNLAENNTFLNGNIGDEGSSADNSYHVVTFKNAGVSSLDGFIITNGNADGVTAPDNSGGGVYNACSGTGNNSNPAIFNCVFVDNKAHYGAAIFNRASAQAQIQLTVTNAVFTRDSAYTDGGAVYNEGVNNGVTRVWVTNATFYNNSANQSGGAVCTKAATGGTSSVKFLNNIFWNNRASVGATNQKQVFSSNSADSASYNLFQSGVPASVYNGGSNISSTPLFAVDSVPAGFENKWFYKYNGLALRINSPGVQSASALGAPATDITGASRMPLSDMGAYQNGCVGTGSITLNMSGCDSVLSPGFHFRWYSSGTYSDTLYNVLGCDTFYTINLTMGFSSAATLNATACGSYTSPSGNFMWDSTGTYYDTLVNASGCDSFITVNLQIVPFNDSVAVTNNVCTALQAGLSYQWFNCNTGLPVNGATTSTFTVTQSGTYRCLVTLNGCADTTECVTVIVAGTEELSAYSVMLMPNPSNGLFVLKHDYDGELDVLVTDAVGKIVAGWKQTQPEQQIDLSNVSSGIYMLRVINNKRFVKTLRVVVE